MRLHRVCWMGGRVVEGSGLENRRACKRTVGSNPTPSASTSLLFRPPSVLTEGYRGFSSLPI